MPPSVAELSKNWLDVCDIEMEELTGLARRRQSAKQDPNKPIAVLEPRARVFSMEHTQLLPPSENLEIQIVARTKKRTEKEQKTSRVCDHRSGFISYSIRSGCDV